MPAAALPIASFAELVAPLSVDEFRALLAARTPHYIAGAGGDGSRYAALLDWEALIGGVRADAFPAREVQLYRDRAKVPPMFLRDAVTPRAQIIDRLLAANASVILNRAERYVPALGTLSAAAAEATGDHVSVAAIATSGDGGALDLHYDAYDIVVLQVDGTKHWSIYPDPVINPVYGMPHQAPGPSNAPAFEAVLTPGDWLFVPAGHRHRCNTVSARSLHLGMLFYPLTPARAIELILRDMLRTTEDRAPLRIAEGESAAAGEALRQRLVDRVSAMPIDALVRLHQSSDPFPARGKQPADDPADG